MPYPPSTSLDTSACAAPIDCCRSLDTAQDLVAFFLQSTAQDLVELDRALARGDILKVASMAHRLKDSAAAVGVEELSQAAARIEACYRRGSFELLPSEVEALHRVQAAILENRSQLC